MNEAVTMAATRDIVVDEVFPHTPQTIWQALTQDALIARWVRMPTRGFEAVAGQRFTFETTSAGAWDGVIHCQVLEVSANQRLVYSWKSGHAGNVGYGAELDTVVTWTLSKAEGGTRVRLVHAGFVLPRNQTAYAGMSEGWKSVVQRIDAIAAEQN
jgi:uncharacterized protein YndB with AHSA1/START domain